MPFQIGQRPAHGFDEPLGLLSDCHRRIEHFLHVLVVLAGQDEGGPLTASLRSNLEAALTYFAVAAPRHTADEEESLFPRLRTTNAPSAARALQLMANLEREHEEAEQRHHAVDAIGRRWLEAGELTPADRGILLDHLDRLEKIYAGHIALEDRELFPAAAHVLTKAQLQDIGREMAARRSVQPATAG